MIHLHVRRELRVNCFPDDVVHVPGFGGEDAYVMKLNVMSLKLKPYHSADAEVPSKATVPRDLVSPYSCG